MKTTTFALLLLLALPAVAHSQKPPRPPKPAPAAAPDKNTAAPEDADKKAPSAVATDEAYENMAIFTNAMMIIRQNYVNGDKVAYQSLVYNALQGMLSSLDPHSHFLEPPDFRKMQETTKSISNFGGIGIVVQLKNGLPTIIVSIEDTPASRAGILAGDQIIKINDSTTENLNFRDSVKLLHGEPGETIKLTVIRPATREILEFPIIRETIRVPSVVDAHLLPPALTGPDRKIGYLRIVQFTEPTPQLLARKLDQLEQQGMEALVLDLRNNPGGLIESAVGVCSEFLPAEQLVVSTEGRDAAEKSTYRTPDGPGSHRKYPLAILINGSSASGAEIVAGALKDLNRAILVGETSFGKGSVQSVIQLKDNSAVKLTTARYYTPSHVTIHEVGVSPHIVATTTPEQERILNTLRNNDDIGPEGAQGYTDLDDPQLIRATDALRGWTLYGKLPPAPKTGK